LRTSHGGTGAACRVGISGHAGDEPGGLGRVVEQQFSMNWGATLVAPTLPQAFRLNDQIKAAKLESSAATAVIICESNTIMGHLQRG